MEAPHTWPWPRAWRLTCQGHSPSSAFLPPTTLDCLVNDRCPQSGRSRKPKGQKVTVGHQPQGPMPGSTGDHVERWPFGGTLYKYLQASETH